MECLHCNFDFTRRQIGVHCLGTTFDDGAGNRHHRFILEAAECFKQPARTISDNLGHPVMVAQIEEGQLAMVAHAVHPAREANFLPRVIGAQGVAGMGAVLVHGDYP